MTSELLILVNNSSNNNNNNNNTDAKTHDTVIYELDPNYVVGIVFMLTVIGLLLYVNLFYDYSFKEAFLRIYHMRCCCCLKHCIRVSKKEKDLEKYQNTAPDSTFNLVESEPFQTVYKDVNLDLSQDDMQIQCLTSSQSNSEVKILYETSLRQPGYQDNFFLA